MKAGFTLIELLVVISIIALLLEILMPSLNKAKQLVAEKVCSSNPNEYIPDNATDLNICYLDGHVDLLKGKPKESYR